MTDITAHCSWCFYESNQKLLKENSFSRDNYECSECKKPTLKCRKPSCDGMARDIPGWAEELCAVCDGRVTSWDDAVIEEITDEGRCSWCFRQAEMKLVQRNVVARDKWRCGSCSGWTVKCRTCDAFAKSHTNWGTVPPFRALTPPPSFFR
jgi:hypothetical protein